jgi:catechol 2,3-dioxygenase-like lactoylglutathione lyase family enzyme
MYPTTEGILESSLYVAEVARSAQFYEKIFGFRVISDFGERGCAMEAGHRQVLLLFRKGGSLAVPSGRKVAGFGYRAVHEATDKAKPSFRCSLLIGRDAPNQNALRDPEKQKPPRQREGRSAGGRLQAPDPPPTGLGTKQ